MSEEEHPQMGYTPERAVEIAGGLITLNWLTEAMRRGEVEHVHIGRQRGVTREQLQKILRDYTVKPKAAPVRSLEAVAPLPPIDIPSISPRSRAHHTRKQRA